MAELTITSITAAYTYEIQRTRISSPSESLSPAIEHVPERSLVLRQYNQLQKTADYAVSLPKGAYAPYSDPEPERKGRFIDLFA
jgi:hypothetical protein